MKMSQSVPFSGASKRSALGEEGVDLLSIVVPCFDEEPVIVECYQRLTEALNGVSELELELIFVDDGSRDRTLELLRELHACDDRVGVIALSRNFGHQVAATAGIEASTGDAVVLIDADLQDPPQEILLMLERWRDGADVVYGVRAERDGESAFKRWSASLFYRTLGRISDIVIPLDAGDFRLMSRRAVDALLRMPERDRFLRGMVAWLGFRQEPIAFRRRSRAAGVSKYPLRKMLRFGVDGILSFSNRPLQIAGYLGFAVSAMALLGIVYALSLRLFTTTWVTGWTLLFIAVLFLGGVQLICLGIMGEYLGRVYGEVKRRPLYLVGECLPPQRRRHSGVSLETAH